ncbi:hypothetical protein [Fuchsiella alkaliacetigena]|uniref:hypothetical protein n=1 Tax=Fuchsiella alkaliacetigena TaxID=957042 RepID=UPI00200B8D0B|nr:hypothetical protein [Fuchsiella alkaliacetigena]MCK8824424.1 hypothetical protein [Fuchsiella alkaliacetigena]
MRVKLEINEAERTKSALDVIVRENMTIGSLKEKMELPERYTAQIMVNGIERSEYYSLDSGDRIVFESKTSYEQPEKDNSNLRSEIE